MHKLCSSEHSIAWKFFLTRSTASFSFQAMTDRHTPWCWSPNVKRNFSLVFLPELVHTVRHHHRVVGNVGRVPGQLFRPTDGKAVAEFVGGSSAFIGHLPCLLCLP